MGELALAVHEPRRPPEGHVHHHLVIGYPVDLLEQVAVVLGDPCIDLQQPDPVGRGVPEELDVERRLIELDMRQHGARDIANQARRRGGKLHEDDLRSAQGADLGCMYNSAAFPSCCFSPKS